MYPIPQSMLRNNHRWLHNLQIQISYWIYACVYANVRYVTLKRFLFWSTEIAYQCDKRMIFSSNNRKLVFKFMDFEKFTNNMRSSSTAHSPPFLWHEVFFFSSQADREYNLPDFGVSGEFSEKDRAVHSCHAVTYFSLRFTEHTIRLVIFSKSFICHNFSDSSVRKSVVSCYSFVVWKERKKKETSEEFGKCYHRMAYWKRVHGNGVCIGKSRLNACRRKEKKNEYIIEKMYIFSVTVANVHGPRNQVRHKFGRRTTVSERKKRERETSLFHSTCHYRIFHLLIIIPFVW